jgi:hypothetical protein
MKNPTYAHAYREAAERFNIALLVARMQQGAGLTQRELARLYQEGVLVAE